MPRLLLVLSLILMASANAFAHPGHGNPANDSGLLHYLTTSEHLAPSVAIAAVALTVAAICYTVLRIRKIRRAPVSVKKNPK